MRQSFRVPELWPFVELDAAIGAARGAPTMSGDRVGLAYDVRLRAGAMNRFIALSRHWDEAGASVGLGVDRAGAHIARALTVPVDTWYRTHLAKKLVMGTHGGLRFAPGERATGWNVGLDASLRDLLHDDATGSDWLPRDITLSRDASRIADVVFVGASIGIGARSLHGWWSGESR
jgi:hypothetical protein